jgi:exonuclease III
MAEIYKVATLNINGMSAGGRMRMLNEFIHKQVIDIILLQEVTHPDFDMIRGYTAHLNVGINKRGTVILTREQISLTNITRLPSGRGMAASYQRVCFVNIYAPSGTANRQEREEFYNVELVYLLRSLPLTMIVGAISTASCRRRTVGKHELQ